MDKQALGQCPLFRELSGEGLEAVAALCRRREYPKGTQLIAPQDRVDRLGIVVSGRVRLMHISPEGEGQLMTVLTPGGVLGADLICTRSRTAPYHAIAASAVGILYLQAEAVLEPGQLPEPERQQILRALLTFLSDGNMKKEYRLAILSRRGVRERVMTYLTMQTGKRGTDTVTVPFSREELASFLCVNRSALSHELSKMEQEGLITFRKNEFTLRKRQGRN